MKIAITGKGGTGKTTITALLAYLFTQENKKVFVLDVDPDGNLGLTLGFTKQELAVLKPVIELKEIINERTESYGSGFYKLNPKVDDIPDRFSISKDNIKLLVLGTIKKGGSGCYCPENTFLKSLLNHILIQRDEIVILDMPAGIEHLSRGTAQNVDILLIVVEPSSKSIQTAQRIEQLALDLNLKRYYFIGNKISNNDDKKFINENINSNYILGHLSYNNEIVDSDKRNIPLYKTAEKSLNELITIKNKLDMIKNN